MGWHYVVRIAVRDLEEVGRVGLQERADGELDRVIVGLATHLRVDWRPGTAGVVEHLDLPVAAEVGDPANLDPAVR